VYLDSVPNPGNCYQFCASITDETNKKFANCNFLYCKGNTTSAIFVDGLYIFGIRHDEIDIIDVLYEKFNFVEKYEVIRCLHVTLLSFFFFTCLKLKRGLGTRVTAIEYTVLKMGNAANQYFW